MILEIACNNIQSIANAATNGADRVELFSNIHEGGLTPSFGTMKSSIAFGLPVFVMIRPRGGDFFYTDKEIETIKWDIESAHQAGVDGIVFGALDATGAIDYALCEAVIKLWGKPATFHRAFDFVGNPLRALETVIDLGFERILTSGLASSAVIGYDRIQELAEQANSRIKILAGAGINPENAGIFKKIKGLEGIHTTAKTQGLKSREMLDPNWFSDPEAIQKLRFILGEKSV